MARDPFPRLDVQTVRDAFACGDAAGWSELHRRHGDTLWLPNNILLTIDLGVVEAMLMHRPHTETRPEWYRYAGAFLPGADGLLFQTNPLWEKQLRAIIPVFHKAHLARVARGVSESIRQHADDWSRAEHLPDLYAAMTRLGAEVAMRAILGLDGRRGPGRAMADILVHYKLSTMEDSPRTRTDRADGTAVNMMKSLASNAFNLLAQARDVRALDRALAEVEVNADEGCLPGLREVAPNRKALVSWVNHLFGAYNAIDYVIVAALVLLEHHQEVRAALQAELEGVADQELTPSLFTELPTLHNFAREVFRCRPVANATLREAGTPFTVQGVTLPAGTQVALGQQALHHDPRYWSEPQRFDPSRWESATPHPPFAYIPFLLGPRRCWGRPLAEMVLTQVLRELLVGRSLRIDNPDVRPTVYFMPRFTAPVRARVTSPPSPQRAVTGGARRAEA